MISGVFLEPGFPPMSCGVLTMVFIDQKMMTLFPLLFAVGGSPDELGDLWFAG